MWLMIVAVLLLVLKLIGFPPQMESVSWWWIALPFAVLFVWFEVIERNLGLDRKSAFDELRKAKEERIKRALERNKHRRASR
jgi:small Trp-rich protein